MPLRVNNNIAAINSTRHLNANNRVLSTRLERLASGLKLNRASDDAAGLSVREGMRAEIGGLKQSVENSEHATNLIQVAEGSLNEVNAILVRMRELAVQSSNSTVTDNNRASIQAEFTQLTEEIDRIAEATTYNNQTLLTGFGNNVIAADTTYAADDYEVRNGTKNADDARAGSTALKDAADTGVTDIRISGAQIGTYTFVDFKNVTVPGDGEVAEGTNAALEDDAVVANTHGEITLGNGVVTQTIDLNTMLDGDDVAVDTTIVANFDRLGIQVTLAGEMVDGDMTIAYSDGDLNGKTIVVDDRTGGSFQVGSTDNSFNVIEVGILDMMATGDVLNLGGSAVSVADISSARGAITSLDLAINKVADQRNDLGANQNRLAYAISWTENEIENIQASEASISDADIAEEVTAFTRAQILSQAATAMLAQANVLPQNALALLQ